MALVLETPARTLLADAMAAAVDNGTTQTGGKLVIEETDDSEVSTHRFVDPAFGGGAAAGFAESVVEDLCVGSKNQRHSLVIGLVLVEPLAEDPPIAES